MDLILQSIAKHVVLTKEEQKIVLDAFVTARYPAKTILLKEGEVCESSVFVLSGILRHYIINDQATEHTISFAAQGWWVADMYSFLSKKPSNSFIEVLEDSIVMSLSREKQLELFDRIPKMERYFRVLIERSLVANQQRLMDNLSLPAEVRYTRFLERFPEIKYCLPQKQIASYLGVTPEFFSKMKKKMLTGK
ncbi:MAG: Crp/Fnr family transcriptional regulator [Flavobacteriaceae bacterium]|nr:Crp/Fnr family transcriptional regulator [Flavobacteriaceae bacterium]